MIKKSDGEWVFMEGSGLGSETTAATSGAQLSKREPKKVLSFKLFKSLKSTDDIQEKFQLGAVLGKGSFGEVRRCLNKQTGLECALKIVQKSHIGQHRVLVELMEQELEVLQKTDHPHIVRVMELLEDDVNFYIVSELVSGGELYDHIIKNKMFSEQKAAALIK